MQSHVEKNNDQRVLLFDGALAQCTRSSNTILSYADIVPYTLLTMTCQKRIRMVLSILNKLAVEARQLENFEKRHQKQPLLHVSP